MSTQHLAFMVDDTRPGSMWSQLLVGVVGVVLGIVLVVGQLSVAVTHGISVNLHQNVKNLRAGNATLRDIVEKAAPTLVIQKVITRQNEVLQNTLGTMRTLNGEMSIVTETTAGLEQSVSTMQQTSAQLASGVEGMNQDTARIADMLAALPEATGRTHRQLQRIDADSGALNAELSAIGGKMRRYGLPQAQNVRGRG